MVASSKPKKPIFSAQAKSINNSKSMKSKPNIGKSFTPAIPLYLGGKIAAQKEKERRESVDRKFNDLEGILKKLKSNQENKNEALQNQIHDIEDSNKQLWLIEEATEGSLKNIHRQLAVMKRDNIALVDKASREFQKKIDLIQKKIDNSNNELREQINQLEHKLCLSCTDICVFREELISSKKSTNCTIEKIGYQVTDLRDLIERERLAANEIIKSNEARMTDVDSSIFELHKEQLKFKLSLPGNIAAPSYFNSDYIISNEKDENSAKVANGLSVSLKLEEFKTDLEAIKSEYLMNRSADRLQFDGLSNRFHELSKRLEKLNSTIELKLSTFQDTYQKICTKIPIQVSEKLDKAQTHFTLQIDSMNSKVSQLEAKALSGTFYTGYKKNEKETKFGNSDNSRTLTSKDLECKVDSLKDFMNSKAASLWKRIESMDNDYISLYEDIVQKLAKVTCTPHCEGNKNL